MRHLALALALGSVVVFAGHADAQERAGRRVDLSLQGADIRDVLRLLADAGGVNIVYGDEVGGTVTMRLHRVRWDDALRAILRAKGLEMERTGNIVRVASSETMARERDARVAAHRSCEETAPLRTRVIRPSYASAADLAAQIRARLTPRGSVSIDERTNSVIVRDVDCGR
jgi:type IV pilus assembly protein PilQ